MFNLNMKNYLEAHLTREDRSKSKLKRETSKTKESTHSHTSKIKLTTEPPHVELTSHERNKKNHQRINSQLTDRHSLHKYDSQSLNKTNSKAKMKTEVSSMNQQTIKLTANRNPKSVEIDNNSLLGLVRNRLMNQSKTRRNNVQHPAIKKLMDLTQKAREKSHYCSKNPEETQKGPDIKDLHHKMDVQVSALQQQIAKQGKTTREFALCEALRQIVAYSKQTASQSQHYQSRLLIRMKELQERNVRLMTLMNKLKREGIDVDSFWSHLQ